MGNITERRENSLVPPTQGPFYLACVVVDTHWTWHVGHKHYWYYNGKSVCFIPIFGNGDHIDMIAALYCHLYGAIDRYWVVRCVSLHWGTKMTTDSQAIHWKFIALSVYICVCVSVCMNVCINVYIYIYICLCVLCLCVVKCVSVYITNYPILPRTVLEGTTTESCILCERIDFAKTLTEK